jgi:hypothetical protein
VAAADTVAVVAIATDPKTDPAMGQRAPTEQALPMTRFLFLSGFGDRGALTTSGAFL